MNVEGILTELDKAVSEGRGNEVEGLLTAGIKEAMDEGDGGALLQLLNELLGFYRETGRNEDAYQIASSILGICEQLGLEGSIPHATSLLNIANAYRAGGRLEESLSLYDRVEEIYTSVLPKDSMLMASFHNNKALLYEELGRPMDAIGQLNKALVIVEKENEPFEIAVTHANLANSYLGILNMDEAYKEAQIAKELFEEAGTRDSHYGAALYAMGIVLNDRGQSGKAKECLSLALSIMDETLGKNEFYYRIRDELEKCESAFVKGLVLSQGYYNDIVAPMIHDKFSEWEDKIAVGLVGRGSDCLGYDDESSMDHDWGPGVLMWVTKETYDQIGQQLSEAYEALTKEYKGFKCAPVVSGHRRRGLWIIEDFYKDLLGKWPLTSDDMKTVPDYALATAVNGMVYTDQEGQFSKIREKLKKGYPESLLYLKLCEASARFSQEAQYNYSRAARRGDAFTAQMMIYDGLKEALKIVLYLEGKYPPHDKWLYTAAMDTDTGRLIKKSFDSVDPDEVGRLLALRMYEAGYISDTDNFLDHHTEELLFKSGIVDLSIEELADRVTRLEFDAFDKVKNEGGRASCQDDFYTFEIMRKSQYLTWNKQMLVQYLYDFDHEYRLGHNLITEKYGRMMESTAPEEYEKIKDNFPIVSEEKKAIIEAIISIQVAHMEAFAEKYPRLGGRARSIHTNEDFIYNTSYETYLRGEISTYSDRMLELYGRYVVSMDQNGLSIAAEIMKNSVRLYGYPGLDEAEERA